MRGARTCRWLPVKGAAPPSVVLFGAPLLTVGSSPDCCCCAWRLAASGGSSPTMRTHPKSDTCVAAAPHRGQSRGQVGHAQREWQTVQRAMVTRG